jgi:hypothetical protein
MALQLSGPISIGNINVELGRSSSTSNTSLNGAQNGLYGVIRLGSTYKPTPNNAASLSEWYGYQHIATSLGFIVTADNLLFYGITAGFRGYKYVIGGGVGSISPSPANVTFTGAGAIIRAVYTSNTKFIVEIYNGSNTVQPSGWDYFDIDGGPRFLRTATNTPPYTIKSNGKWVF